MKIESLSLESQEVIGAWKNNIIERNRATWEESFLELAHVIKKRSHDAQTQCGCIIANDNHQILGVGYNGFPRHFPDDIFPNCRPDKYPWMIHSEVNAILNCEHKPRGGIVYVTGHPCFNCLLFMYQSGIKKIVYDKNHSINMLGNNINGVPSTILIEIALYYMKDYLEIVPFDYKEDNNV